MSEILSYVLSILSMIVYGIVYLPQIILIYKTKSSDGLSPLTILSWTQADFFSLLGVILLNLELNLVIVGWYHFCVGIFMIAYVFRYQHKILKRDVGISFSVIAIDIVAGILCTTLLSEEQYIPGTVFGWISSSIYIIGRFPQIVLNYQRKSTEGLSIYMYIFTILGNTLYTASILTYSTESDYIITNLPWIVLTIVTVSCDFFVIFQSQLYKKKDLVNVEEGAAGTTQEETLIDV